MPTIDEQSPDRPLGAIDPHWGQADAGNFGYDSDEERKAKRGLEDWELVERIPASQRGVPYWFFAVVAVVFLVGLGLSFPFWGLRPGVKPHWFDWGYVFALFYCAGAGWFVWYMVRMYGSPRAGRLDSDPERHKPPDQNGG